MVTIEESGPKAPPGGKRWIDESDYAALRLELEKAVRRLCPSWLAESREDLVQVALLRMFEARQRAEESGEKSRELAASYLWRVASTALVDEIRRRRRRPEVELDEELAAKAATPGPDLAAALGERQVGQALRACLQGLVEARRLAVTLHLQGYAVDEAASLLAWEKKKVYNSVHRGLADLRECLKRKGVER